MVWMRIGVLYALFAAVATAVNLTSQSVTLNCAAALGFAWGTTLVPALIVGTGARLIVKYVLDKRYIFKDRSRGVSAHAKQFSLYTIMSLVTTAIFWATELLFALFDRTDNTIYLGGGMGLAIGYTIKYYLDRRYVFTPIVATEGRP
jgi:putative flippase GtrA